MVYNVALNYVQNIEDAEEITQDVFLKVHESLASFKKNSTIKTWIYRITINQSLDFLKKKKAKKGFIFLEKRVKMNLKFQMFLILSTRDYY